MTEPEQRAPPTRRILLAALLLFFGGCGERSPEGPPAEPLEYAIAIHGGAGAIPRDAPEALKQRYLDALVGALELGREILDQGGTSLDAVEQVIRLMEDEPLFNAGRGAVLNSEEQHELDASIMDGENLACGAVASVTTVRNPISLARAVMSDTPHVLLSGAGAEQFADEQGVERVPNDWFSTPRRREDLERARSEEAERDEKGTVGVAALDRQGRLAAGTSTGGLTNKRFGRIGDSPIIGAGTYADSRTCAVSATGIGEEFIRRSVAFSISELVALEGISVADAANRVIHDRLQPGDGGVIVVGRAGEIALAFNTDGMYRGAADSSGRFEVAIW